MLAIFVISDSLMINSFYLYLSKILINTTDRNENIIIK